MAKRVSWSEEGCRVLGLPLAERARSWQEFLELVHPDDRSALQECYGQALNGESGHRVAFRLALPGTDTRWAETIGQAVFDEKGQTIRAVGAVQDISERRRAGEAHRSTAERFQLALQTTGLAPWGWDLVTNTMEFSPEWKRQIGYEPEEIPDRYEEWDSRLHPDDRERVLSALHACRDGVRPEYSLECRLRHRNGTYRWIYTRVVLLRDGQGRQTHVIGCHLDITDRKQLEEQFRHSQKMQAVGQLAGGVAHDFNNLLAVIGGYAELIAGELGSGHRLRRDIDEIRAATTKAATLTRQLLAFSRRQILQPQVLDLDQVLYAMHQMLTRLIGEDVELAMNLTATERVCVDPGQIDQVIMNLAVNARDAMPTGGHLLIETTDVTLDAAYVGQHPGASAGRYVMLAVTDTGTGMDEATRIRLFEPFFTTKPVGHGTGLGLATVYGIVQQSGGWIWAYSELGKGSTFKIYLPVATSGIEPPASEIDHQQLQGTETVLVVEDQREVRELIEKTLRRYGYQVFIASNGTEAVAAAKAHDGAIHVMLTDVVLPGAGGRAIAQKVVAERPSLRVLYMSGYTQNAIVQHGVLEPGLAFIQKPFSGETLVRTIREVLAADSPPLFQS